MPATPKYPENKRKKMMGSVLTEVWIIANYPVFRAAMQLPLSGGNQADSSLHFVTVGMTERYDRMGGDQQKLLRRLC